MDREEFDPSRDLAATGRRVRRTIETGGGPSESELYTVDDDGGFSPPSETYLGAAGHDEAVLDRVRAAAEQAVRPG